MSPLETAMPPYPWQHEVWQVFCRAHREQRLAHALLLSGIDGVGIESLSIAMTRLILCHSPLEDLACGRCRGCELFKAESNPDYFMLEREENSAQIKIDQVRALVDFAARTPHFAGNKVVIVNEAHCLNVAAANALLKSLEEPPGACIFLLVTQRPQALLPTIRSRCQQLVVRVPVLSDSVRWLQEQGVDAAAEWLEEAGGAPLRAKAWALGDYAEQRRHVLAGLERLLSGQVGASMLAEEWVKLPIETLIQVQISVLDRALRSQFLASGATQKGDVLQHLIDQIKPTNAFRLRDTLTDALEREQQQSNLVPQLVCESLAMSWESSSMTQG